MRVLLLHNRYRLQGGEERSVSDLEALLRSGAHDVWRLERSSVGAGRGRAARAILRGGLDPEAISVVVRRERIDVVHAHNVHPLLGWRALAAARAAGARTVLHLHNFRLFCAVSTGYRDHETCFLCQGRNTLAGLRHNCRGSVAEAAAYAGGLSRQQPRLLEHADRLIAVSQATAERLLQQVELDAERMSVLPNFAAAERIAEHSRAHAGAFALVAGRIVEEKGFDIAIAACVAAGVPLKVAGEGPGLSRLRSIAPSGADIEFTGRLSEAELTEVRTRAALVLAPSRWEEPWPYAVLDAMAAGVPVLASRIGGLPEMVGDAEALIAPGDLEAWGRAVAELWRDPARRASSGEEGLRRVREQFGQTRYLARLEEIYAG